jgi:hypothetical protein
MACYVVQCFAATKCFGGQISDLIVGIIIIGRSCSCIVITIIFSITITIIIIVSSSSSSNSSSNIVTLVTTTISATHSPSPCKHCPTVSCDTFARSVEL